MSQKLERFHKYLDCYEKLVKRNAGNFVEEQFVEDVVQETFMRLYQLLDELEDEQVKPWLLVVSRNLAIDYLKKGGKYSIESMTTEDLAIKKDERTESVEELYEKKENEKAALHLYKTALDLLYEKNPDWHYVIIAYHELEMSSAQIGKKLGLSAGYVDVIRHRARSYLRKKMGDQVREMF